LEKLGSTICDCRKSQIKFFDARRRVSIAAKCTSKENKIDLELMDDSDEEKY